MARKKDPYDILYALLSKLQKNHVELYDTILKYKKTIIQLDNSLIELKKRQNIYLSIQPEILEKYLAVEKLIEKQHDIFCTPIE